MFLRWMCRQDNKGVDFGLWKSIPTASLSYPLDVHSGNVARKLNLLTRKQNDAKALLELDTNLCNLILSILLNMISLCLDWEYLKSFNYCGGLCVA